MTDNHYDENIVSQLTVFGYSKQQIIDASNSVVDYKDINTVQAKLDAHADCKPIHESKSNKKSKPTKSKSLKSPKLKLQSSPDAITKSKSAKTPKTKKMKKKAANSWIKSNQTKHDASVPSSFSRQTSIMKLKQIATVSKRNKKPKKQTLIDIIYESDEDEQYETDINDTSDDDDSLMPPILDRRFGLSADSGMNIILNEKNKEIENNDTEHDNNWITQKNKKKTNHTKAELSLLFDFRDFESKNNRSKDYVESIQNIESDKATQAIELMKQKTFNAVKLKQDIKEKAIKGFTVRLETQKKLMESGFTSVPLINDEDFIIEENENIQLENNDIQNKKMNKRDMLKQALKNEKSAMEHCVMIVEELGFLKYMKDDDTYMQLMRSKENALRHKLFTKRKNQNSFAESDENKNEPVFDINLRLNAAQMALNELKYEMKDENKNEPYDLFKMNNSNILLSLKQPNCQLLTRIISKSFVRIESLRFIELCNCGIDDYFMSQMCLQLLEYINKVEINTLSLQSNFIGDNGVLCLCEYMKANNKYLKVIKLQNNRRDISTGVCKQICEALEINNYVTKFEFEFRHYGEKDRSYQALKRNIDTTRVQRIAKMNQISV